jgi:hypothetical protein
MYPMHWGSASLICTSPVVSVTTLFRYVFRWGTDDHMPMYMRTEDPTCKIGDLEISGSATCAGCHISDQTRGAFAGGCGGTFPDL